jgi:hypothetical protein
MLRDEDEDGRVEVLIALWGALALALALACVRGTSGVGEAPRWRSGSWTDRCVTSVGGFRCSVRTRWVGCTKQVFG